MDKGNIVFQFRIELPVIEPSPWRVIQVPATYTFWDLHVAIQDAMGWLDCHLHEFHLRLPRKKKDTAIGIPDDYGGEHVLSGWDEFLADYFFDPGQQARYTYDFGDGWVHTMLLEGILLKQQAATYPRCIAGERTAPPEDCGGVPGYYELLAILADADHPEYDHMVAWLKGHGKNYYPYDPARFDPAAVKFSNPRKRLRMSGIIED